MVMTKTVRTVKCLCGDVYPFEEKDVRLAGRWKNRVCGIEMRFRSDQRCNGNGEVNLSG